MEGGRHALEDAHRPVALDVGVPAHRADAGAGAADVALQQEEVDHLAQRLHRVLVLGEAHGPADDGAARGGEAGREALDLRPGQTGRGHDLVPVQGLERAAVVLEAARVLGQERLVEHRAGVLGLHVEQQPADGLEQGHVPADADLEVVVAQLGAREHAHRRLRVLELHEPGLGEGVDRDDDGAVLLGLLQRAEHPRVVGARVLAGDHDELGLVEVLQRHRALADADGLAERGARGLVAHVGAVGQVVGAVAAHEQLPEERRLVGGAARGVEHRVVGAGQGLEGVGDGAERLVPADLLVVVGPGPLDDGVGEASLLAEPPVRLPGELGEGVLGEELRGDPAQRRLLRDGLGAVLAELRGGAVLRVRPGAAGAVEAVLLVQAQQGAARADRTHLLVRHLQRLDHGGDAGGVVLALLDGDLGVVEVLARGLGRHQGCAPRCWCRV